MKNLLCVWLTAHSTVNLDFIHLVIPRDFFSDYSLHKQGFFIFVFLQEFLKAIFLLTAENSEVSSKGFRFVCVENEGGRKREPILIILQKGHCLILFSKNVPSMLQGFPCGSDGKASAYNAGDTGLIPGSSGEGNGNPLQYSCLENPMDGGAQ